MRLVQPFSRNVLLDAGIHGADHSMERLNVFLSDRMTTVMESGPLFTRPADRQNGECANSAQHALLPSTELPEAYATNPVSELKKL